MWRVWQINPRNSFCWHAWAVMELQLRVCRPSNRHRFSTHFHADDRTARDIRRPNIKHEAEVD